MIHRVFPHAVAALAAVVCAATVATAQVGTKSAPKTDKPSVQLDGIEYRVVDRVWANVDGYFHEGDYNRVVALCRICTQSDPDFDEAYSCGAWILWSMDDKPAANAYLADGTARAKDTWKAHATIGEALMVRREYKDALPHLQAATQTNRAPVIVWKQLAHAYERTGDLQKSLATWNTVLKKFPNEPAAPVNKTRVEAKIAKGNG